MSKDPDYYDSQTAAAAALAFSVYDLKAAKADGCPAFRSGRVYRKPLLDWLAARHARESARREPRDDMDLAAQLLQLDLNQGALFHHVEKVFPRKSHAKARLAIIRIRHAVSELWDLSGLPDPPEPDES